MKRIIIGIAPGLALSMVIPVNNLMPPVAAQTCSASVDPTVPNCIGPVAWPRSTPTGAVRTFWMEEYATLNPLFSLPASNGVVFQHCNNRFTFKFNDAGTARWFYLQLDSDSGTWTHTTSDPCS